MLEEIRNIRRSLQLNFTGDQDGYTRKMFRFAAVAEEELQEVRDGILQAEKQLRDVQTYYCEGEEMARPMQSQDFFGIFRTFTSSYKVLYFVEIKLLCRDQADDSFAALRTAPVQKRRHRARDVHKRERS